MTLAINILMGVALINEVHYEILPKKTTVAIHFTIQTVYFCKRHLTSCILLVGVPSGSKAFKNVLRIKGLLLSEEIPVNFELYNNINVC